MRITKWLTAAALVIGSTALSQQFPSSLSGFYRGEFLIQDSVQVPFNFRIGGNGEVILINADERFASGYARQQGDSLFIPLDQFDNQLALKKKGNIWKGVLRKQADGSVLAELTVLPNRKERFIARQKPSRNISGKYEVRFINELGRTENALAIFRQDGSKLKATFLKPSGDSRYLDGVVEGERFYLSSFIGSTPGYYRGTVTADGDLKGEQIGTKVVYRIEGKLNNEAEPGSSFMASTDTSSRFVLRLPDMNGKILSLDDEKYRNKVVLITIGGTWCPNCIDEARFLSPWYEQNKSRGIEIIGVHFERQSDTAYTGRVMRRFRERFDIGYDQVFGGITSKDSVLKALPSLKDFKSYPTMIFLDRNRRITKIHSGYSGPATGKYYDDFVKEFNDEVDRIAGNEKH